MRSSGVLPGAYRLAPGGERSVRAASQPRCVFIEVTNRCNLACATCVRTFSSFEPSHDLSVDEFEGIVAQFPELERAVLHGIGEPLLNTQLPAMIGSLKARGVEVLFNTNGTLLTRDWQEALLSSGLDELRVSIDAADDDAYARIRGRPLLSRVTENLRALISTQTRLQARTPRVSIWAVATRETLDHFPDLIRLAAETGVSEVYVQRLTYAVAPEQRYGAAVHGQALFGRLSEEERQILEECAKLAKRLGVELQASGATGPTESLVGAQASKDRPWSECRRPWTTAYITANGNALPCCIAHWADTDYAEVVMGNIWRKPFAQIWNGGPYRDWRKALLGDWPKRACSGCGVYWSL